MEKRKDNQIIEPETYNFLKKLIEKAETADEVLKIAKLGTTYKRTGFHFSPQLEKTTDTISYFKKNTDLSFSQDKNGITHKLIIGDNYQALLNLLIQYRGKIDVIYIDPPYGKDSMGEFARTNYNNNITRDHLLSMLYPRLLLARQLLSETGVIFCSIDDKNQAYVKCLFDEIFEEKNFIGIINCLDNLKGKENDTYLSYTSHYVLTYTKQKSDDSGFNSVPTGEPLEKGYPYNDENGKIYNRNTFKKTGAGKNREDRPSMFFPILIKEKTLSLPNKQEYENLYCISKKQFNDNELKKIIKKYNDLGYRVILPQDKNGTYLRWTSGFETCKKLIDNGDLEYVNDTIYQKKYPTEIELIKNSCYGTPKNFIYKEDFANATNDLNNIGIIFSNPKSVSLIKYLISLVITSNSCKILDFFAGSGTTGQAVLELNKEDGGNRQYICVQLNEITDITPNGIVYDVTSKRLKRVMTGKCYDGSSDFEWIKKHEALGGNLDVYNIAEVANFANTEGKTPFDVIDETLYGKEKFSSIQEKIEWVCSNFEHTQKRLEEK